MSFDLFIHTPPWFNMILSDKIMKYSTWTDFYMKGTFVMKELNSFFDVTTKNNLLINHF